jgi:hypothetical protein
VLRKLWLGPQSLEPMVNTRKIRAATALSHKTSARFQRIEQSPEQTRVIEHPVERRRAEDRVRDCSHRHCRCIRHGELDSGGVSRPEAVTRDDQHVGRRIDRQHTSAWQAVQQRVGQTARAAADVEYELVAPQRQAFEDDDSPLELRIRDAMVRLRVPLTHGSAETVMGSGVIFQST